MPPWLLSKVLLKSHHGCSMLRIVLPLHHTSYGLASSPSRTPIALTPINWLTPLVRSGISIMLTSVHSGQSSLGSLPPLTPIALLSTQSLTSITKPAITLTPSIFLRLDLLLSSPNLVNHPGDTKFISLFDTAQYCLLRS